jgi:hypothetical protein
MYYKDNPQIPLHIYQTWNTKDLPPKMNLCVEKIKKSNPEFKHHLFDDTDCRDFIKQHFDTEVLNAYDCLIPGAYRADLWRYCILYKWGGIYLDIKYEPVGNFRFIEIVDKEYWVLDRPYCLISSTTEHNLYLANHPRYYEYVYPNISKSYWENKKIGVYNALIICKPQNQLLKRCINRIVENVRNQYYGYNPLYPTGPGMISDLLSEKEYKKFIKDTELFYSLCGMMIVSKQNPILKHYKEYRDEQKQCENIPLYPECWEDKKIYKKATNNLTIKLT